MSSSAAEAGVTIQYGPAMRALVEGVVAAHAAVSAEQAVIALKAIGRGAPLDELVEPGSRALLPPLFASLRAMIQDELNRWIERTEAPDDEIRRALGLVEKGAALELEEACAVLQPGATGPETALVLFLEVARRNQAFEEDLIARDIGWATARYAFAAGEALKDDIAPVRLLFSG